ncbi:uncharacterized protein LOC108906214 isoform X2 [Anoplophora glabripennis]|nr:uncharacterized protein LOC108906214 isoform X2 [Anoplophora glabripennis]XP_023310581.1 uncharacterized protein LOC108906214 isoform X2 [Anoplophora glabripennis]
MFDNMAFYDSVSVIAGRAIVTIDPLPEKVRDGGQPVVQQPRRLRWQEQMRIEARNGDVIMRTEPSLLEKTSDDSASSDTQENALKDDEKSNEDVKETIAKKAVSFERSETDSKPDKSKPDSTSTHSRNLTVPDVEIRKKSLRERRMSKSLYLKIDFPKEVPVIRQNSMPKFFLDTPEHNQTESTLVKGHLTSLQSPMVGNDKFSYDLYSVVQREKTKSQSSPREIVPIHRESSRLALIKEKIKLKKSKSTVSASNIPHSNYI